jgi:hypothetical protein
MEERGNEKNKPSYTVRLNVEVKMVLGVLFLGWLLSLANALYYYYEIVLPNYNTLGDHHFLLYRGRVWVTISLVLLALGIWLRRLAGKILGMLSILLIFYFYLVWYFEKFRWLAVTGIYEGTDQYSKAVNEIGLFRGANGIDFLLITLTVCVFFWIILRYPRNTGRASKLA